MPKVWIVSDNGHDFSRAAEFGDSTFLFAKDEKINVFATDALALDIQTKLAGAAPADFLIPTGNAVANCIAYAHLMMEFGQVNVLIYSFRDATYELRTIRDTEG